MESASASKFSVLLPSQPLDAFFLPAASSSPSFLGSRSMMSFEDVNGSTRPFFRPFDPEDNDENEFEEFIHQPEKKRRLTLDQVQFLEKSFEVENKLEPDRKIQLAKDLGLQPRQVAIWFQNRRARWKTKQLEKDYDALLNSYNTLKADYDTLLKDTEELKSEVNVLTEKLKGNSESCNKDTTSQEQAEKPVSESVSKESNVAGKQEDISSAKSDIFDADSPHYTDGVHSLTGDSSYVFEAEQSDLSQDEGDNLTKSFFPPYVFPKLEDADYSDDPPAGFEDQTFWTWSF